MGSLGRIPSAVMSHFYHRTLLSGTYEHRPSCATNSRSLFQSCRRVKGAMLKIPCSGEMTGDLVWRNITQLPTLFTHTEHGYLNNVARSIYLSSVPRINKDLEQCSFTGENTYIGKMGTRPSPSFPSL